MSNVNQKATLDELIPDDSTIAIVRYQKDWRYWSHEELKGKELKEAIRAEIRAMVSETLSGGR